MSEDQYTKLFKYMETRFESLEAKLDTKADKTQVDKIYNILDGMYRKLNDHVEEQAIINHRYNGWIGQLADHTGATLVPERS